jgi:transcriptional regulator with XRE-family HTH domain
VAGEDARAELGAFLRAMRARLRPADVGLPDGSASGRRRTPGLRREEVAQLSGVGVTWYTWLEQGRRISASLQVVDALARALQLTADEHQHLRLLAGLPAVEPTGLADHDVTPRLQRLVDAVMPNVASVCDVHFDYVAWNRAYTALRQDPALLPADRRNLLWMMFAEAGGRSPMRRWESAARAVLSQFRVAVGQRPGDPRFADLVSMLSEASPQFRAWWAEYPVRSFQPVSIGIQHPAAGLITFELFQLRLVERPDLVLVLQIPARAADLQRVTAMLAAGAAAGDPVAGTPGGC